MSGDLYSQLLQCILCADPALKCRLVSDVRKAWRCGDLSLPGEAVVEPIEEPGRPPQLRLVDPRAVPKRSLATDEGRRIMLHAFAHIEFNAINLALDAAYRFRHMPRAFIDDWLRVAEEEAHHFGLLQQYLAELGVAYGDYAAHNGLWDMVLKTRHDVLHRMALVPRVMEARGLDVTPGLIQKFNQVRDTRTAEILQVIYDEEIGHVAIGNRWFHYCCEDRGVDPRATFRALIEQYFGGSLRGPFNREARRAAGFDDEEINQLELGLCGS